MDLVEEEEVPLSVRLKRATEKREAEASDEDEPDWLRNHQPQKKQQHAVLLDDSDSEDILELKKALGEKDEVSKDAKEAAVKQEHVSGTEGPSSPRQVAKLELEPDERKVAVSAKEAGKEPSKPTGAKEVMTKLPILLPEKISRNKVLVECSGQDGSATDLSGDHGAVGRIVVSGEKGKEDVALDLKGTIYSLSIAPCCTMCVLGMTGSELKVEAMVNDFVQLREQTNLFDGEVGQGNYQGLFDVEDDEDDRTKRPSAGRGGPTGGGGTGTTDTMGKGKGKKRSIDIEAGQRKKAKAAAGTKARGRGRGSRGGSTRGAGRRGKR